MRVQNAMPPHSRSAPAPLRPPHLAPRERLRRHERCRRSPVRPRHRNV